MQPIFLGAQQGWAKSAKDMVEEKCFSNFGPIGIAADWKVKKISPSRCFFQNDPLNLRASQCFAGKEAKGSGGHHLNCKYSPAMKRGTPEERTANLRAGRFS
jgi:hypothetical protein